MKPHKRLVVVGLCTFFVLLAPPIRAAIETAHQYGVKVTGHAREPGAPLAVELGIDSIEHGYGLTDEIGRLEIEQLVFSGISEMDALIAATRNSADMVGMLDQLGTVEEGKIADLIGLQGNPLDHISNIRKLKMVFKDGLPVNLTRDEGQTSFWELYFR